MIVIVDFSLTELEGITGMKEIKGGSVKVLTRTLCHDIMGLDLRVQSQL